MNGLYKGKYLIAVYDDEDNLIDVGCTPSRLNIVGRCKVTASNYYHIYRVFNKKQQNSRIHFIDCTEKHDDIFAEEDEIFLEYIKNINHCAFVDKEPDRVKAERLGVSLRTYMRHKAKGTLYKLENKKNKGR